LSKGFRRQPARKGEINTIRETEDLKVEVEKLPAQEFAEFAKGSAFHE